MPPRNLLPAKTTEAMEVLLIRHKNGRRPQLHLKPRGGESMWNEALQNIISRSNLPAIPYNTLTAIEPHLSEIGEMTGALLAHRKQSCPGDLWSPADSRLARYAERLYGASTPFLQSIHDRLLNLARTRSALDLIAVYFPARLREVRPDDTWVATFSRFLHYVEDADWFPIDREAVEMACQTWQEDPEEDNGEWLAAYMECIPLPAFIPAEEEIGGDEVTRVFFGLFENHFMLEQADLTSWGLSPADINEDVLYRNLMKASAGNALLPETCGVPLRFLPGIATMYRRETGYRILDELSGEEAMMVWGQTGFTWEHDVDLLRKEWQACRPLVDRWDAFHTWCVDETNCRRAVELALRLGGAI